jgi:hypothetical protein
LGAGAAAAVLIAAEDGSTGADVGDPQPTLSTQRIAIARMMNLNNASCRRMAVTLGATDCRWRRTDADDQVEGGT